MEIKTTGIPGLDEIIGGGIACPSTIFIAGSPGSGRTTLGVQSLCEAARKGEKVLYVSVTTKSQNAVRESISEYGFYEKSINIRTFSVSSVERDPLTMLVELGNYVAELKPDRVLIDPVTPIGFGFPEAEKRRFMYSLHAAIGEWNSIVYLTGTMSQTEVCRSVIGDIADGIVYLSHEIQRRGNIRILKIMKMNNPDYIEGEHSLDVLKTGINIYPRLKPVNALRKEPSFKLKRIDPGIPGFNDMVHGGIFELSSTLIVGSTGTGKTLFGLHFIVSGARKGIPGIISTFKENPAELRKYASTVGAGLEELEDQGLIEILYIHPSEINSNRHKNELVKMIERTGAKRIILDDIAGFDYVFDDHVTKREHIASLIELFKSLGLTSMLICDKVVNTIDPGISAISMASDTDLVIVIKNIEDDSGTIKAISVLKMHGSDHEKKQLVYNVDDNGITIGQKT